MTLPNSVPFCCLRQEVICEYGNNFGDQLPSELQGQFRKIFRTYILNYGFARTLKLLNGRTASQIVAEYQLHKPEVETKVVRSGRVDGVGFTLFEAPPPDSEEDRR